MSARNCPECGGLVASTINVCPHCGHHLESVASTVNRGVNPYNSLAWSIVSFILFWPFGLVSLIYYIKSDGCWNSGDVTAAELYGTTSMRWAKVTVWIFVGFILFIMLLSLIAVVAASI